MRPKARPVVLAGVLPSLSMGRRKPDSTVLKKTILRCVLLLISAVGI